MERGGSSYSDEQSVDSFPDEESVTETEEETVRIPKMMVK
jgi:hypothetical protein